MKGAICGASVVLVWYTAGLSQAVEATMAKRVTPAQTRRIVELHEEGHTLVAIAAELGLDRHTVARHVSSPLGREDPLAGVTPKVLQTLLKLAATVDTFACPACKAPTLRLQSQCGGWCPKCTRWWNMRNVQGVPWATSPPAKRRA